ADLGAAAGAAHALHRAGDAAGHAGAALPAAAAARLAFAGDVVVDHAVTVVVDAVALLGLGANPAGAHQLSGRAGQHAGPARADRAATRLAGVDRIVIGHAVAVVIEAV